MASRFPFIIIILLASILLFMGGALGAASGPNHDLSESFTAVLDFEERVLKKKLHERVYIDIHYPQFGISFADTDIKRRALSAVFMDMGDFDTLAIENYAEGGVIPNERSVTYNVYASGKKKFSVVLSSWFYFGTAHGNWSMEAATYDPAVQKKLALRDIFPDWEKAFTALPLFAAENFGDNAEICLKDAVYFTPEYTNFYLKPNELVIVYSGLPMSLWGTCSTITISREGLARAGSDMRYWKE